MGTGWDSDGKEVEIDDAYWEGCTRWRQHEGADGQTVEARAPRCTETASDAKCDCGVVICQQCKDANRMTDGDIWQTCNECVRTIACSKCIGSLETSDGVLRGCVACDANLLCDECRTTCNGCGKTLCRRGDCSMYNGHCESCYQDGRGRSRSRSRSGSYERQMEFEMRSYGRY